MQGWLHNPLPDIALQDFGLCLLSQAFEQVPELMDDSTYIQLPMYEHPQDWDWARIEPEKYIWQSAWIAIPMAAMTNKSVLKDSGLIIGQALMKHASTETATGIVKGSVRLHVAPSMARTDWLDTHLFWLGNQW